MRAKGGLLEGTIYPQGSQVVLAQGIDSAMPGALGVALKHLLLLLPF